MADFCKECNERNWGPGTPSDFEGMCEEGKMVAVLCEGCGRFIWVDHEGRRIRNEQEKL